MFEVSGELGLKVYNAFFFFNFSNSHVLCKVVINVFLYQAISRYKRKLLLVAVRSLKM